MNELTLEWHEAGQDKTQKIHDQQPSKNPGSVRIGRDPMRCDIVMSDPTVSGLHIEIFFNSQKQCFYIRNLRDSNPPMVDGNQLQNGELPLNQGSTIFLGRLEMKVTAIFIPGSNTIPPTVIVQPTPRSQPVTPHVSAPAAQPVVPHAHTHPVPPQEAYGLMCTKCNQISPYAQLEFGCPWCGTSLAAAVSALIPPNNN